MGGPPGQLVLGARPSRRSIELADHVAGPSLVVEVQRVAAPGGGQPGIAEHRDRLPVDPPAALLELVAGRLSGRAGAGAARCRCRGPRDGPRPGSRPPAGPARGGRAARSGPALTLRKRPSGPTTAVATGAAARVLQTRSSSSAARPSSRGAGGGPPARRPARRPRAGSPPAGRGRRPCPGRRGRPGRGPGAAASAAKAERATTRTAGARQAQLGDQVGAVDPGMPRSSTTTSGSRSTARARVSRPSPASPTSWKPLLEGRPEQRSQLRDVVGDQDTDRCGWQHGGRHADASGRPHQ